jgi:hypothetical protein
MRNISANWIRSRTIVVAMLFVTIFGFVLPSQARADEWNKKTIVTFTAPVEIPGKVLPAGTYVFKLLDSASDRNIVQVYDKDEKTFYAMLLAVPNYRLTPADKPVINFEERPSGTPEAVKAWFYPGDQYGVEFVYPNNRAKELAKRLHQNVLSMRNQENKNLTTKADSNSDASVKSLENTPVTAVNPAGQQMDVNQEVGTKPESKNKK